MAHSIDNPKGNSSWKKVRKFFNDIHLWLGIASGVILFLVCLSGTIYTFSTEIQEFLSPEMYEVEVKPGATPLPAEEIIDAVKKENEGATVSSIAIPADKSRPYEVVVKKEGERRGTGYLVDPYTGSILGDGVGAGADFFMFMFRLHRWLLLDTEIGRPIVGWATIIFVVIILTGFVIWFPVKIKAWRQGLKIKINAKWKRINHDLHNALGLYSSLLLLIMALTGLAWSFDWYRSGLSTLLGTEVFNRGRQEEVSNPEDDNEGKNPLSIHNLIEIVDKELPYTGDYSISLPSEGQARSSIYKNHVGFFAPSAYDHLEVNVYTGEIVKREIFSEKPFNEKIAASIKPLHMGYIYGTFSKIIYFIACLIATSLPVTGTIIWINKLKKKRKKRKRITSSRSTTRKRKDLVA